jgi:transposase-like protein
MIDHSQKREETTMPQLIKEPSGFSEGKPVLQFLQDTQSDLVLKIDELHSLRDYVMHLPVTVVRAINPDHLESLIQSDPNTWPPIAVTLTNIGYICYDGLHRLQACKVLKTDTIRAKSMNVKDLNQLIDATFHANLRHGLRASRTTRSDYCYWLSLTYPKLSHREIAARVGVSQSTVTRALEQRRKEQQDTTQETTIPEQEEGEETKQKQAQHFTNSTSKFLKVASGFLHTVPKEEYEDLVWNLQVELLNGPEDKLTLLRTGQLLIDVAKARRKAKVVVPSGK